MDSFKEFISKFTPYLEDIRRRLYVLAIIFIVFFAIGFLSTSRIIKYFLVLFDIKDVTIATTSPFQFADLSINIGLFCAFLIIFPILIYHLYSFLKPAISKKERSAFLLMIPLSVSLFISGFIYGFFIMYYALIVLANINVGIGIQNVWDVGVFMTQIVLTSAFLGILFQFPIILTFCIKAGIIQTSLLKQKRRLALIIIAIFTTLLPPTDGLSLIAMALPLILLYEITIFVNSRNREVRMAI